MRNTQKSINFTIEEDKKIRKAAEILGLSYASFLRSAALEKIEKMDLKNGSRNKETKS